MQNRQDDFNDLNLPHSAPASINFSDFLENSAVSLVRDLPNWSLEKKMEFFWPDQLYLKHLERFEAESVKMLFREYKRMGKPLAPFTQKDKEDMRQLAVRVFLGQFFGKERDAIIDKLFQKGVPLSTAEHRFMFMFVKFLEKYPALLESAFGRSFQDKKFGMMQLLEKDLTDCADVIGKALSTETQKSPDSASRRTAAIERAEKILEYGIRGMESTEDENIQEKLDVWVTKWLDKQQLVAPHIQEAVLTYLSKTPPKASHVLGAILPFMRKIPIESQGKIWDLLFDRINQNPDLMDKVIPHIQQFCHQENLEENLKLFYNKFSSHFSPEIRPQILGKLSTKTQRKYWTILCSKAEQIPQEKVQAEGGLAFLGWHLLQKEEITQQQMLKVMEALDPHKYPDFFLCLKKGFYPDILTKTAHRLAEDPAAFYRWIQSFQNTDNFQNGLTQIWPNFSDKIRGNEAYSKWFNTHFDLVYHLAQTGDTGSLSLFKRKLETEDFWNSLIQEHEDGTCGLSFLCRAGKRPLFNLIKDLPPERQQELFLHKNSHGKSALDECRGEFLRMVQEQVFQQKQGKTEEAQPEKDKQPGQEASKQSVPQQDDSKALYPRKKFFLSACQKDLEKYRTTNPDLYQEIREAMQDLATMSGKRMSVELREGLRNRGLLDKTPCSVREIRGNNYRLGYKVFGNADRNQGKIVFLFFWTHQEYDSKLYKTAPGLVQQAISLIKNLPQPNPGRAGNGRS